MLRYPVSPKRVLCLTCPKSGKWLIFFTITSSESESDFNFAFDSTSDSKSESDDSESDFLIQCLWI